MDLATIDDINVLKVMAYDRIALKEQAERELKAVNQRIEQIMTATPPPKDEPKTDTPSEAPASNNEQPADGDANADTA